MVTTSGDIYELELEGLDAVFGCYHTYKDLWTAHFKTSQSHKSIEFQTELKTLGSAMEKADGQSVAQDTMDVRFNKSYKHVTYGLSFGITDEALSDNLYKEFFPQQLKNLANSLRDAKNQTAANVFNTGHTTTLSIDKVPLFSNAHPLANGKTISNRSNVALSEIGIEEALVGIQQFRQYSGLLTNILAQSLVVGPHNQFAANKIVGSNYTTSIGTAGGNASAGLNDINSVSCQNMLPKGVYVNQFITSPSFSAICTDAEEGLIHYEREKLKNWDWVEDQTLTQWYAAKERYSFGASNWRCGYMLNS